MKVVESIWTAPKERWEEEKIKSEGDGNMTNQAM